MSDDRYIKGTCMMCLKDTEVRHINLYIIGSEGFDCCHPCEMEVIRFIRDKRTEAGKEKLERKKRERVF